MQIGAGTLNGIPTWFSFLFSPDWISHNNIIFKKGKNNKEINVSSRDMKRKRVLSSLVMGMLNLALIVVSFGPVIELGNVRFPVVWTEPVRWPVPVASLSCHARWWLNDTRWPTATSSVLVYCACVFSSLQRLHRAQDGGRSARCVCGLMGGRHSFTFDTLNVLSRRQNQRKREIEKKKHHFWGLGVTVQLQFWKTLSFDILLLLNIFFRIREEWRRAATT